MRIGLIWLTAVCVSLAGSACGEATEGDDPSMALDVQFRAVFSQVPFACGQTYSGIGLRGSEITPSDLRMYIHDVRLVDDQGGEVPMSLDQKSPWQHADVALLDFEDRTETCINGTVETNDRVIGTVAAGDYHTLRFTVGVPFELNHGNQATASSPLNLTSLFWSWNAGDKVFRLDASTVGLPDSYWLHLGSTGCQLDDGGAVGACSRPNRAEIALTGFTPNQSVVIVDLAELLLESDIDANAEDTAPGCMAELNDSDCIPILGAFGVRFADDYGVNPSTQRVFRLE